MFIKKDSTVWFNGEYKEYSKSLVPVFSHSLSYATSFYEGIRRTNNRIFKLEEHVDRLFHSATAMKIEIPYSKEQIISAVKDLFDKKKTEDAYIKILCFLDDNCPGYMAKDCNLNIVIGSWDLLYPFNEPVKVKQAIWKKPLSTSYPYDIKNGAGYLLSYLVSKDIEKNSDYYFIDNDGFVCEATGSNILFISGNKVSTPYYNRCLKGITCETVINEICPKLGIDSEYRDISVSEIPNFESALLCGTAVGVVSIASIDNIEMQQSNNIAVQLIKEYNKMIGRL